MLEKEKDFMGVRELSKKLGFSTKSIYQLIRQGQLPAVRFCPKGKLLIPWSRLEKLIESKLQKTRAR